MPVKGPLNLGYVRHIDPPIGCSLSDPPPPQYPSGSRLGVIPRYRTGYPTPPYSTILDTAHRPDTAQIPPSTPSPQTRFELHLAPFEILPFHSSPLYPRSSILNLDNDFRSNKHSPSLLTFALSLPSFIYAIRRILDTTFTCDTAQYTDHIGVDL